MVLTAERRHSARAPVSDWPAEALSRSRGFGVESPIGTLGAVEAVRFSGHPRRPVALVVRVAGPESRTTVLVPLSSIESIDFEAGRVLLRPGILLRRSEGTAPRS
jgi:hypothetical protein